MVEEENEMKGFGFIINIKNGLYNKNSYKTRILNSGVPTELIIMQMRAFLDNLEQGYFNEFKTNQ